MDEYVIQNALGAVLDHYDIQVNHRTESPIRCPAHDDAHASASANISKGVWFCHACGAGGNALHVIMDREECSASVAYEKVLELMAGVDTDPVRNRTKARTRSRSGKRWTPPRLRSA